MAATDTPALYMSAASSAWIPLTIFILICTDHFNFAHHEGFPTATNTVFVTPAAAEYPRKTSSVLKRAGQPTAFTGNLQTAAVGSCIKVPWRGPRTLGASHVLDAGADVPG